MLIFINVFKIFSKTFLKTFFGNWVIILLTELMLDGQVHRKCKFCWQNTR